MTALSPLSMLLLASIVTLGLVQGQVIQGEDLERFLSTARFTAREPLGSGVTSSLKVTLQQDSKRQFAVLKTVDQRRPGLKPNAKGELELDFQDSWRTEVAAYELDKLIGLGMVPATVERRSPYENAPASLQLWVEAAMSETRRREKAIIPPDADSWSEQLADMALFDALIYNTDRHPDNLLITEDFRIRLIDHSRSFRPNAELRNKEELSRFSRSLVARLEQLERRAVERRLGDYLSLSQIEGLMRRRQLILDLVRDLANRYGERAVFYP